MGLRWLVGTNLLTVILQVRSLESLKATNVSKHIASQEGVGPSTCRAKSPGADQVSARLPGMALLPLTRSSKFELLQAPCADQRGRVYRVQRAGQDAPTRDRWPEDADTGPAPERPPRGCVNGNPSRRPARLRQSPAPSQHWESLPGPSWLDRVLLEHGATWPTTALGDPASGSHVDTVLGCVAADGWTDEGGGGRFDDEEHCCNGISSSRMTGVSSDCDRAQLCVH
ncbi:hypothetical protein PCL_00115 [Purpureocillium lilacinum]|uniref:Uncharacterized protein n=1 Tax=Purpureocillium lilacinum TaxID=33203 RepID=A0A2U3E626_PURLI|nr:hypothetical protein Purlil1_5687 [Purpureocillium lilacinum]PWI69971.1 hypothetical protein PCL_00115 [Purpureocillium lilacinum]